MPPDARAVVAVVPLADRLQEPGRVFFGADVDESHVEEFFARIAVGLDSRVVDPKEAQRIAIVDPHGIGICGEPQCPTALSLTSGSRGVSEFVAQADRFLALASGAPQQDENAPARKQ